MEAGRKLDHEIGYDFTKLPPSQWGDHFLTVTITDSVSSYIYKYINYLHIYNPLYTLPACLN